jgi:hypothetical protein
MPLTITSKSSPTLKAIACDLATRYGLNPDDVLSLVLTDEGTATFEVDLPASAFDTTKDAA